ncbi:hypothetical protein PSEWESI4_00247 [Pseudomonas carbonaria]|uniref:Uncharacterized protein n=1 Tax=Zestomonas carbonaria TaxID=2762745 RepID=A0A7U7EJX6_9GAMM|nr:hypothetical protein PSEWESI4_00247 [Pseudomonas carbonaria]
MISSRLVARGRGVRGWCWICSLIADGVLRCFLDSRVLGNDVRTHDSHPVTPANTGARRLWPRVRRDDEIPVGAGHARDRAHGALLPMGLGADLPAIRGGRAPYAVFWIRAFAGTTSGHATLIPSLPRTQEPGDSGSPHSRGGDSCRSGPRPRSRAWRAPTDGVVRCASKPAPTPGLFPPPRTSSAPPHPPAVGGSIRRSAGWRWHARA